MQNFIMAILISYFIWFGSSYGDTIRENEQLKLQQAITAMADQMTLKQLTQVNFKDIKYGS